MIFQLVMESAIYYIYERKVVAYVSELAPMKTIPKKPSIRDTPLLTSIMSVI